MITDAPKLSPIQVHLLRFFSERNLNDEETQDIQRLIAHYYAEKADLLMDEIWQKNKFNDDKMLEILNSDLRK